MQSRMVVKRAKKKRNKPDPPPEDTEKFDVPAVTLGVRTSLAYSCFHMNIRLRETMQNRMDHTQCLGGYESDSGSNSDGHFS